MTAAATMYTAATAAAASSTASLHLPVLRTSSSTTAGSSSLRFSGSGRLLCSSRFPSVKIRASSSEETATADTNEIFTDLKDKWDALENKSTVVLYGGGAVVAVWLSLPKIMELVGLGYTGWFVYRYLLFKQSRKELAADIDTLKKKIAGTE
ncbi:Protein CURVATURE THYLAKOID 1A, chloroplastic [Linum grandiflorum]